MGEQQANGRRELLLFLFAAALPALATAALFHLRPWPTPMKAQADVFGWTQTGAYLLAGAIAAFVATRGGAGPTPALTDRRRWLQLIACSLALGLAYGTFELMLGWLTPWNAQMDAQTRAQGITWVNVGLPWSLLHYAHGSILSECAFRMAAILIPTWLVSHVLLRGRWQPQVFWSFAVLAACIEPIEKAVLVRKWPLLGMGPLETLMTLEGCAWQLAFAWLLRRYGWGAPMIARYGYYLMVRIGFGYFLSPDSLSYPGPH
ncbi:MAG: hypothetical protein ABI655_02775 [Phenylobacterium sp.]